jgi:hypothetical protein
MLGIVRQKSARLLVATLAEKIGFSDGCVGKVRIIGESGRKKKTERNEEDGGNPREARQHQRLTQQVYGTDQWIGKGGEQARIPAAMREKVSGVSGVVRCGGEY